MVGPSSHSSSPLSTSLQNTPTSEGPICITGFPSTPHLPTSTDPLRSIIPASTLPHWNSRIAFPRWAPCTPNLTTSPPLPILSFLTQHSYSHPALLHLIENSFASRPQADMAWCAVDEGEQEYLREEADWEMEADMKFEEMKGAYRYEIDEGGKWGVIGRILERLRMERMRRAEDTEDGDEDDDEEASEVSSWGSFRCIGVRDGGRSPYTPTDAASETSSSSSTSTSTETASRLSSSTSSETSISTLSFAKIPLRKTSLQSGIISPTFVEAAREFDQAESAGPRILTSEEQRIVQDEIRAYLRTQSPALELFPAEERRNRFDRLEPRTAEQRIRRVAAVADPQSVATEYPHPEERRRMRAGTPFPIHRTRVGEHEVRQAALQLHQELQQDVLPEQDSPYETQLPRATSPISRRAVNFERQQRSHIVSADRPTGVSNNAGSDVLEQQDSPSEISTDPNSVVLQHVAVAQDLLKNSGDKEHQGLLQKEWKMLVEGLTMRR